MKGKFEKYYQELESDYTTRSGNITHYNSDRSHNAAIMVFMLEHSDTINMYCGEMSIFREGFYEHIEKDECSCAASQESSINDDECFADFVRQKVVDALHGFIQRDGTKLNILLENKPQCSIADFIGCAEIRQAMADGKISIRYVRPSLETREVINHFTYADHDIYRLEIDKDEHTATCMMFNDKRIEVLEKLFSLLNVFSNELPRDLIA